MKHSGQNASGRMQYNKHQQTSGAKQDPAVSLAHPRFLTPTCWGSPPPNRVFVSAKEGGWALSGFVTRPSQILPWRELFPLFRLHVCLWEHLFYVPKALSLAL